MTGTTGDGRAALDGHDARLLLATAQDPRATVLALAEQVGLSRNTVQARLAKLDRLGALDTFERRVDPAALGYPLTAFVTVRVVQRELAAVADALDRVPEVLEVHGISGPEDLMVHLVARDADDLYRIAGHLLAIDGWSGPRRRWSCARWSGSAPRRCCAASPTAAQPHPPFTPHR